MRASAAGRLLVTIVLVSAIATAPLQAASLAVASAIAVLVACALGPGRTARALGPAVVVVLLSLAPIAFSLGVPHAARVAVRALAAVITAVAVAGSIPTHELAPALAALHLPVPVAAVLGATLRQMAVLRQEGSRLVLARKLRGASGHRHGALLVGALFTRAAERAARIDLASRLRSCSPARALVRARLTAFDVAPVALAVLAAFGVHASRFLP